MSKTKSLLKFYQAILASLNIRANSESRLSLVIPTDGDGKDIEQKCLANGKRVTLPSDELLKAGDWSGMIPFHPLSENLLRGESEIIHFLRNVIQFRLAGVIGTLMTELLSTAASPKDHVGMSPSECEYLSLVADVDDKTVKILDKLLKSNLGNLVKVYLKRNGTLNGKEHRRVATVNFPIWDELTSTGTKIYKTSAGSIKNKKVIANLFNYIIPKADEREEWSVASDSDISPYFHSILRVYMHVTMHLNELVDKHERLLSNSDLLRTELSWIKDVNRMSKWRDIIPPMPGNKGATVKGDADSHTATSNDTTSIMEHSAIQASHMTSKESSEGAADVPWDTSHERNGIVAPVVSKPVKAKVAAAGNDSLDWRSVMSTRSVQQMPMVQNGYTSTMQPVPAQQMRVQMGYPQQGYGMVNNQQMQPAPAIASNGYYQNTL